MRQIPTALGVLDPDDQAADWHRGQVRRLARTLGYALIWAADSMIPLADQARQADVDIVIVPSTDHLSPLELNSLMAVVPVESVCPRMSFPRWHDSPE